LPPRPDISILSDEFLAEVKALPHRNVAVELLRKLLASEAQDELGHATYLMDVIADLGGEPTTTPRPFDKPQDIKGMIELNVKMEAEDVENYLAHAALAEELGLADVKMKLEEMAADEAGHGRELRRLLKGL